MVGTAGAFLDQSAHSVSVPVVRLYLIRHCVFIAMVLEREAVVVGLVRLRWWLLGRLALIRWSVRCSSLRHVVIDTACSGQCIRCERSYFIGRPFEEL